MIIQIRSIFKLSGEAAIVWIRNFSQSLALSLVFRMTIAGVASVAVFLVLGVLFDCSSMIHQESFDDARFFIEKSGRVFIVDIDYVGIFELLVMELKWLGTKKGVFFILSSMASMLVFFFLSAYLIFKRLSYLKEMETGIKIIAHKDMRYKIPIKGKTELARLARCINCMGDTLHNDRENERQHEIAQRTLVTNISHDLKTPLTSITGYIDIIESRLDSNDELRQYAHIAKRNANRLEKLIEDLFLYSSLISGDLLVNLQSVNVTVMVGQLVEMRAENIVYTKESKGLWGCVDPDHFHGVMDNLFSNAVKYGVEGKPIAVSVREQDDNIFIAVQNYTNQHLEGKMDLLKTRLYTASEDRSNGSSGLGLSIVSELTKAMNGTLDLSYEDKSFAATVRFPKA